jgi:hypothetical protein
MSSLQQNWITKGWNRFCLEVRGKRTEEDVAQTMYIHISKLKTTK